MEWPVIGKVWQYAKGREQMVPFRTGGSASSRICRRGGTGAGRLHFLPTFKALGAFIHLRISMVAAIMTGPFTTDQ